MSLQRTDKTTALSPVIAVILLIAITVGLVGVLSGQLFQFPSLISTPIHATIITDQTISQDPTLNETKYNITITVDDMGNAEQLIAQSPSGVRTKLTRVGEKITFTNIQSGKQIEIIAKRGGDTQLLRQITVKG